VTASVHHPPPTPHTNNTLPWTTSTSNDDKQLNTQSNSGRPAVFPAIIILTRLVMEPISVLVRFTRMVHVLLEPRWWTSGKVHGSACQGDEPDGPLIHVHVPRRLLLRAHSSISAWQQRAGNNNTTTRGIMTHSEKSVVVLAATKVQYEKVSGTQVDGKRLCVTISPAVLRTRQDCRWTRRDGNTTRGKLRFILSILDAGAIYNGVLEQRCHYV
jgi:hypothetical protein